MQTAPDRINAVPLEEKSAPPDNESTLACDDSAAEHCESTPQRHDMAPHRIKSTTHHREAAPYRMHLLSIDAEGATSRGPSFFHRVKSARVRSECNTYGVDAANVRAQTGPILPNVILPRMPPSADMRTPDSGRHTRCPRDRRRARTCARASTAPAATPFRDRMRAPRCR